jgi:hypothetical protein
MASSSSKSRFAPYVIKTVKPFKTEPVELSTTDIATINYITNSSYDKLLKEEEKSQELFNMIPQRTLAIPTFFVVAFPYDIRVTRSLNTISLECTNINENLLFKTKDIRVINVLAPSMFKVLINKDVLDAGSAQYDKNKKKLTITVATVTQTILRCIIFFNIFYNNRVKWTVPKYLTNIFGKNV